LIAIAQSHNRLHYLKWVASENGPLISKYGSIVINQGTSINEGYLSILNELEDSVVAMSIDSDEIYFSNTKSYESVGDNEIFDWHNQQVHDIQFSKHFDTFRYPFDSETKQFFNIHIPIKLKESIISAFSKQSKEIVGLSVGIFSAEMGARQWFKANHLNSYIIWKMGKYHLDQMLVIVDNELKAFIQIKRTKSIAKVIRVLGNQQIAKSVIDEVNSYIKNELSDFNTVEKVFVYQSDGKFGDVRKIIESHIPNIILLNPFSVLEIEGNEKINLYQTLPFAEVGVAFRGVDV
jgi:hypothetical protein